MELRSDGDEVMRRGRGCGEVVRGGGGGEREVGVVLLLEERFYNFGGGF